jgi:hypothetical protein
VAGTREAVIATLTAAYPSGIKASIFRKHWDSVPAMGR